MQVYNIEVFDRNFLCVYHDQVSDVKNVEDYIDMQKNTIMCRLDETVKQGQLISISDGTNRYIGIVQSTDLTKDQMEITYYPFYSAFDFPIVFDTDLQGSGVSLESVLKDFIVDCFINNADAVQNIPVIGNVNILSATTTWGFNIKSDKEGMHKTIINLYQTLLKRSFNQYGIVVECVPDFANQKIDINIGKINEPVFTFETSLKNVIQANVLAGKLSSDINKLVVIDDSDFVTTRTYYLHSDGTYDTNDTDRLSPVREEIKSVSVPQGQTFEQVADSSAADIFSSVKFNNNIELEMLPSEYTQIKIGQMVDVIHNGVTYSSILSKKEIADTCKLTFGCIRMSLTYLIKKGAI